MSLIKDSVRLSMIEGDYMIYKIDDYEKAEKWAARKYDISEKSLFRFGNIITSKTEDE